MIHFILARNLPYSVNDVKKLKPQFYKPPVSHLIKATQHFECLNVDFKVLCYLQSEKIGVIVLQN